MTRKEIRILKRHVYDDGEIPFMIVAAAELLIVHYKGEAEKYIGKWSLSRYFGWYWTFRAAAADRIMGKTTLRRLWAEDIIHLRALLEDMK